MKKLKSIIVSELYDRVELYLTVSIFAAVGMVAVVVSICKDLI